jgi:hypothetical protein
VRVRFQAADEINPSIVEAAVDDIKISVIGLHLTDVVEDHAGSAGLGILQPNPFRSSVAVPFRIDREGSATLAVFDVQGRMVRTLVQGSTEAGLRFATWNGRDQAGHALPAGLYIIRLTTANGSHSRKVILLP